MRFVTSSVKPTICYTYSLLQTEGEGNGKKLSKKKAAEKMMEELKKLPPLATDEEPDPRVQSKKLRKPPVVRKYYFLFLNKNKNSFGILCKLLLQQIHI